MAASAWIKGCPTRGTGEVAVTLSSRSNNYVRIMDRVMVDLGFVLLRLDGIRIVSQFSLSVDNSGILAMFRYIRQFTVYTLSFT